MELEMVKVKICGVTRVEDALECARLGADAVGVIVEVSVDTPRKVSADKARKIFEALPRGIERFSVIMPRNAEEAAHLFRSVNPDVIQLHGKEPLSLVEALKEELPCKLTKTIHVLDSSSLEEAKEYSKYCDYILLDTPSKTGGGSGRVHDWTISRGIVEELDIPVILSGGLNPENIGNAVKMVKPHYVDVSSGVESGPGVKDSEIIRRFIVKAKSS